MHDLSEIIKNAQKILYCPICKRRYQLQEIKLTGFWQGIYMFNVNCSNKHQLVSMSVIISEKPLEPHGQIKTPNIKSDYNNIKLTEVDLLNTVLTDFDGDFEKLWKK